MAENLFLKSPSATAPTATAPVAPPLPEIKTLPARQAPNALSKGLLPPPDLQPLFEKYSAETGVPLNVLSALAQQESGYDANAIGEMTKWGTAKGMLQNLDSNAKALGIDPMNPEQAIAGAARQLRERLDKGYSMEDAVKAHFGGDNRKQWGEKTQAYGQEVLAKASIIGSELMAGKKQAAPGNDLAAIQAEMDAKEPGRYKVIDPADIARRDQERAAIASGQGARQNAQQAIGDYEAPSPYPVDTQARIEDRVNAQQPPSPLTITNQDRVRAGIAPKEDLAPDGFMSATSKQLQNVPEHFKNAAGGIIRRFGEQVDDQTLVSNAENAGILNRMKESGAITMVQDERGNFTPTLPNGKPGDISAVAAYIRKNADNLMSPEEAGAMLGMKPNQVAAYGANLSKEAHRDELKVNPDGPLAKYGSMIIGSTAEMVPAIVAGVVTKNPATAMGIIGGQVYGQSYDQARQGKLNPQDAANYALAQAAAEAIPEALPLHFILKPGQNFFKGILSAGAAEAMQESVTQLIQSGLDKGSINPDMTWAQAREQLVDAAIVGAGSGAALRAGVHGIQKAVDAIPSRNREAEAADEAQADFAPTGEDQQTQAPAPDPVAETPAPAPTGPLTRAAQKYVAPEPTPAPAGEPVTVRSSDGEMAGTLESYQDDGQGNWTARVLADDGNAYDFTQDDGVSLDRAGAQPDGEIPTLTDVVSQRAPQNIPTSGPVGKIPTLTDVVKPGVEIPTLTEEVPTLTDVVEPEPAADPAPAVEGETRSFELLSDRLNREAEQGIGDLDEPQLRAALKDVAKQIKDYPLEKNNKDSRNGYAVLTKRRKAIEKAIGDAKGKAPAVTELAGEPINKEWTRFADDSGSLSIPRADMPQIKAEHRGAMVNFLNARGIQHTQEEVPASSLKPTQEEFSPAKVKKALGYQGGDRSILISSDGHVLDGHHQWLAKVDGDQPVKVIRLDAPIKQLLDEVRAFPSATTADGATATPTAQRDLKYETKAVREAIHKTGKDSIKDVHAALKTAQWPKVTDEEAQAILDSLNTPAERKSRELNDQSKAEYSKGHAITHNKRGLRMRDNDPLSPAEQLEAEEHFLESFRLDNEAKLARGEPIGDIAKANYARDVEKVEARRASLKEADDKADELRRLDPYEAQRAAIDYVKWLRSEGVKNINGIKPGIRGGRTFQLGAPLVKKGQMLVDGLHAIDLAHAWKESGGETKPAETASEVPETASPAPKPASTPQQKAKERKENRRQASRDRLGVKEGEQFIASGDVGYATAGQPYTVESIDSQGNVFVKRAGGSSGTSLSIADLESARRKGVTYTKVEAATPEESSVVAKPAKMEAPAEPAETAAELAKAAEYGASNKLVSQDRAAELRERLKKKLNGSQLNAGIDPEILALGAELAVFHIEAGVRKFADFAKTMADDLDMPLEKVRPYLRSWYNGARDMMEDNDVSIAGMDDATEVRAALARLDAGETAPATSAKNAPVQTDTVVTPDGTEFEVRDEVVEASSLITSNSADGKVNPAYPKALQPRDRSRSASLTQINDIAANLNPKLLGKNPSVTDGAPIVSPDNEVESGNGRTLAIQQAYARGNGAKYRAWIESQGHDTSGMAEPVLIRRRVTPMTEAERVDYTTAANERTTLALSSTERAIADGKKMGPLLHLFHGGDVAGAANREFVRAFMGDVAGKSDRGSLMDSDGMLSQDGRRRIEAALLAAAYDDPALINDIFESADSDIKSIGGALLDAAGPWAQMRQESRDGQISKAVDVTPNLMEAVNLVRRARTQGKSVFELVNQNDIFSGELDQATKDWVSVFYRGASLARARGRDKVADALLTYTQLARATQPGTNLFGEPELTGADLIRGTHDKLDRQESQADQQQGLFGDARPNDQGVGARRADGQRPAPGARGETTQQGDEVNAASTRQRVEPDRADPTAAQPVDATAVSDEPAAAGRRPERASPDAGVARTDGQRDQRLPTDGAVAGREPGDQRVHQPDGTFRPESGTAGGAERARSGSDRVAGEPIELERAERIVESAPAADASEFDQRLAAQKKAAGTKTVRGDKANIDAALPLLLDPQRDDVLKAEQRFAVGNGMLLTNGTGTGKTASGMGVVVRSINAGKPNALVIVPSDKIAADWIKFAKMLGVDLKLLESTSDNGKDGQVITTYANFGANDSLALRDWDQFVADEAHYLSSNEKGEGTAALARLQALTGHHDGFYQWVRQRHHQEWQALQQAQAAMPDQEQIANYSAKDLDALTEARDAAAEAWAAIEAPAKKAWQERWTKQQDLPKTLFLSATPFAYVKSVDYAEGYLFDYVSPAERYSNKSQMEGYSYNSGDAREKFFMQHFGYRMRYNKLTAPEAGVDSELMEQNFNQHLKEVGALSGRRLEVPYDYDRKFVVVDDAVGQKIDQGLAYLREHADGKYRKVYDAVMATFDYQKRMYLLESIKARAVVPMIQAHMKLGRKVVVFHDYNKGGGFDPFNAGLASITEADTRSLAREAFDARPDIFKKMDLKGLRSPIDTLTAAFPDALFFNGTVPKKQRRANADAFNDDESGNDLIVLQSDAGREGVSLHDTTGKHMRVLINLGMPGKPVAAIQIEGRTYRTGQASDAAFRYLTTGTAWEASAFASKIAERASTAENLALGTDARGLKQSFIDAYNGAEDLAPSADDGKGGKELDRELAASSTLSPFNKAKAYYFAQQKNTKRRDQREGVDYFATPEPVGFKMAEWANIQKGDDVLEPSAGHGAIARFFPPLSNVTMVEPSYDLSQRAALANGNARIINDNFEALHLTNKYDAIVMNPPYGNGGKTAIEHVAKAAKHLREGGRIVALIPRGGLTDKRLAAFLESDEAANLYRVATVDMPAATFERAGTSVNTQILVLEKHSNPDDAQNIHARTINLSNAESTAELFDRIEHLDLPDRSPTSKPEPKVELIEHITGKGKRLTGIVRTDLTKAEAQEIDAYTFAKDGGWFIRSKHLGDGNRLSVRQLDDAPATHQEVQDAITQGPFGPVVKKLIDAGHIVIHGNVQSLPDGVAAVRGIQAVTTPDGKVHLVAANLTPGNANGVLLHEMFHSGVEQLVGSQRWEALNKRLSGLYQQAEQSTGKAREVFDRARERVQQAMEQGAVAEDMTAEEFGAYAIEEYEQLPGAFRKWVDDLVGAVKAWLFSRYGKQLGQVTPAQLRALAKDALVSMALAKRGELFGAAGTMFSTTEQTNTPAFKRWFGDSKVIDSAGKPLVVYHGAPDVRGIFADGFQARMRGEVFFAAADYAVANSYADAHRAFDYQNAEDQVIPLYLSMQNPMIVDAHGRHWKETERHVDEAKAAGHDGIIIKNSVDFYNNPKGNGKTTTVYAWFKPTQAKSAVDGQLRSRVDGKPIKDATGNNGEFDPENPNIRYSVKPSKVFQDLTDKQKSFLDKIGPEKLPKVLADRWRQLTDNLGLRIRQAGVDRYAALLRNDQALYGADTLEGSIASSAWVLARMSPAAGGAVHALLNNGRIYLDRDQKVIDIKDNTTGLGATLRKLGNPAEIDRFMGWIAANRSKRLLGEGRENLFTPEEIEAGIKLSGGKLLDGKPRGILYQQAWKEFQQHRDDVLGIAEATGIITPEQRETWSEEFYVPFYRVMDEDNLGGPTSGGSGLSRQQAYKKLKGGKQHLNDLLENTLLNFHHLLQASLRNQASAMAMTNAEQLGIASPTTESRRDKKSSTFVMVDGEKQWYNINDPMTFKAVSALTDTGMNTIAMRVMRGFKRFFTNMTTITPQFVVANAIRDTLAAMATSPTSAIPLKNAFQGALTYGNSHQRARMMASGGAFSFGHVYGQGAHEMKVALTGTMRTAQVLRDPKLIPNILLNAWRKYHNVTDFAENMNRAGIWKQNESRGKLKAAFEARDLMDFSAHGDAAAVRFFIDVVPFLNARIQGLDKLYRSGGKPALKTMFGKGTESDKKAFARFAAVVGALTAFSVMLYLRNKDDEDYRKLEDWQRDTYWVIKIGDNMFFIPKPFEVGSIATMGERLMEQFVDPTVGGEKLASRAGHMLMDTFSMNPIPQAFKPVVELGMNENSFTGRPIEDQSMSRLSPSLRARPDTSRLSEASSRGIESTLGVAGAGNSALSPVQIDHLIQGYFGAVGSTAVGLADTLWRRSQGESLPARSWDEYQPVKRFYKDLTKEDNYTRYGTDFYAALKKADQAYADLQHLAKFGEEEKAVALENKKSDVLALRGTLVGVNRNLARINAEMKRVQMDKDMDGDGKRMELDRLRSMRNLITEEVGKELEQQKVTRGSAPQ